MPNSSDDDSVAEAEKILTGLRSLMEKVPVRSRDAMRASASHLEQYIRTLQVEARRRGDPLRRLAEGGSLDELRPELLERRW